MKKIVRTQPDSPVRRFAKMVADTYSFPVIIGVVSPFAPKLWGKYQLNDLLAKWSGRTTMSAMPDTAPLPPILQDFVDPDGMDEIQRNTPVSIPPHQRAYQYMENLWKVAKKHKAGKGVAKPPQVPETWNVH